MRRAVPDPGACDAFVEPLLHAARIPGAALAVIRDGQTILCKGYGCRDLAAKLPLNTRTIYPIASTTKAFNATLLGTLVDEGKLAWDAPVQTYLPRFRLGDAVLSAQVTLRDLVTMRTGLPRHDWFWAHNPISRPELVERLRHLELSAGLRERFQYCNLSVTTSGHIAEVVTARPWTDLIREKLLEPLGMSSTGFALPESDNIALSYHENATRELLVTKRRADGDTAPSGSAIHSTIEDMARWVAFNLSDGTANGQRLIAQHTLAEIHRPQVAAGTDPSAPTPNATYAMGWFVDSYNGSRCLSHSGYLYDVIGDVMLFPQERVGIVSFTNFGASIPARLINQHVFDLLNGSPPACSFEEKLEQYEHKIQDTRKRAQSVRRVLNTSPSHALGEYAGVYVHPGYGNIEIHISDNELALRRNLLVLPLQHWHYDAWVAKYHESFPIQMPHAFDATSRLLFETDVDGRIAALMIRLEPAVAPLRFVKQSDQ